MEQISTDFRKEFNLPSTEGVIQNYHCSHGINGGTLYISQNYVCFSGGSLVLKLPFGKISAIHLQGLKGFRSIEIKTEGAGSHTFGLFAWPSHCKQAYALMNHIWKNPPSYIDTSKIKETVAETLQEKGISTSGGGDMAQQQRAKVDVETARLILKTVAETDAMQNHAMMQLEEQARTLDRIDGRLDNMASNLKRADHLMKGIESLPYYVFGGSLKKDVSDTREKSLKDRSIRVPEDAPPIMEVEILFKGKDSLIPALIALDIDKFKIVDPKTDKLIISGSVYSYTEVESLLLRSRHEYMDIKLRKKDTVRLVSAYLQIITNQLHTRCHRVNQKLEVIFEPGALKFDYQDEWLYKVPPPKRGQAPNVSGVFAPKTSSLLTDAQQRRDMEEVEGLVDQTTELVKGIKKKGEETNKELSRQIEQIKGLEGKSDALSSSIQSMNTRMDKVG